MLSDVISQIYEDLKKEAEDGSRWQKRLTHRLAISRQQNKEMYGHIMLMSSPDSFETSDDGTETLTVHNVHIPLIIWHLIVGRFCDHSLMNEVSE